MGLMQNFIEWACHISDENRGAIHHDNHRTLISRNKI